MNGEYKAMLDQCLSSYSIQSFNIINCELIDDVINLSDHKPLLIILKWDIFTNRIEQSITMLNCDKIITLPSNFENFENNYKNMQINKNISRQDIMYYHITSSIKSAYCKCSRVVSTNTVRKNKSWW